VTFSSALAALSAGLDRDEQLARAACDSARADTEGDAGRWFVDEEDGRESAGVTSGFPQRVVGRPGGANGVVVYDEGYPHAAQARLIAEFDPARVLRQSEKLRDAAALLDDALNGPGPEPDLRAVCTDLAEILASIYDPEDTTETEKP
jgi:hypothetical protein